MLEAIVTIIHIITCLFLVLVVLLQSGKGGGVSAAFGGGAGAAIGQRAAATVLGKLTAFAAGTFMVTSMVLAIYSSPSAKDPTKDADEAGVSATETAEGEKADGEEKPAEKAEGAEKAEPKPAE